MATYSRRKVDTESDLTVRLSLEVMISPMRKLTNSSQESMCCLAKPCCPYSDRISLFLVAASERGFLTGCASGGASQSLSTIFFYKCIYHKCTLAINAQNKIMNLTQLRHSQMPSPQAPKPLPCDHSQKEKPLFLSRAQRFTADQKDTPGPGAYDGVLKEKHTSDYRVIKNKMEGDIANQHQWIFSNGRLSLPAGTNKYVGPGLYNLQQTSSECSNSSWAKRQRFNQTKYFKNPLGPGQYDSSGDKLPQKEKAKQLSVFKSRSPRTFFEEMILREKKEKRRQNPEEEQMQSQQVVKFDQTAYPVRKRVQKLSPVFLSKCARPEIINEHSPQRVGPGSYSVTVERAASQKNTGIISGMHYNIGALIEKKPEMLTSKIAPPGPGTYQTEAPVSDMLRKKPLGVMAKEERFKNSQSPSKNQMPGPGEYMQKRYTLVNQQEFHLKNKHAVARGGQKSHDFGTVGRSTLRNHSEAPFGEYNVQLFDIEYRVKKQREHYQKLKMMEVTLPAFNSKQHNH